MLLRPFKLDPSWEFRNLSGTITTMNAHGGTVPKLRWYITI